MGYMKIKLDVIDPNEEVPDWDLSFKRTNPCSQPSSNEMNNLDKANKRQAEESPEQQKKLKRKKFVPEWQIGEFLWMFLEGTKTVPEYDAENLDLETESIASNDTQEEAAENTPEATEAEENLDIK